MENLEYEYNIRGWLLGANRKYIGNTATSKFAFELGYDKTTTALGSGAGIGFNAPQLTGNITGMVWRSFGDGKQRKYDFTYDAANRLTGADFNQYDGSSFNKTENINFSVSNLTFDANGNILSMHQQGLKVNTSPMIDQLTYSYFPGTNRLQKVVDGVTANNKLGDFNDGTNGSNTDYDYDPNGNLTLDNNKAISAIVYNHLNLPSVITVTAKGNITYTYDASGSKLKKVTVDNSVGGKTITNTTTYLGALVFESKITSPADPGDYTDRLQFAGHEEGRTRFVPIAGATPAKLVYDYFLKDHLGNVRMVLTDDQQTDAYPAATMETATAAAEETYYSNLPATRVARPTNFPAATGQAMVAKVSGAAGASKVGPAIILKVMAGDKINLQVNSFWQSAATPGPAVSPLSDLILAMATAIAPVSAGKAVATELQGATVLSPNITPFLNSQNSVADRPKAYINWILLDEQFKYVSTGSGFEQVDGSGILKTHMHTNLPVTANGYLYIYVSNETDNIDVFFDNLQVSHIRGPLLEETHYYPFGLTIAGISSKALNGAMENKFKFNKGSELQNKEFSDGSGLEIYATNFRELDPQVGRWWQIDPKPDYGQSLYSSMDNNPISKNDPLGDVADSEDDPKKKKKGVVTTFWKAAGQSYKDLINGAKPLLKPKNWVAGAKTGVGMLTGTSDGMKKWAAFSNVVSNVANAPGKFVMNAPSMSKDQWAGTLGYAFGLGTQAAIGGEFSAARNEGRIATEAVAGEEAATNSAITVTREGVALPKGANIPAEFIENKFRSSSYGVMENGKFVEKVRIDPATPVNMKGPNVSHFHLNGGNEHIYDSSRWLWHL